MGLINDLSGKKFGRLKVIERLGANKNRHSLWLCECDCGNKNFIANGNYGMEKYEAKML